VPAVIANNKGGDAAKILKEFGEPAWNYQIIRFIDAHKKDLIPRRDQIKTIPAMAKRMIATLEAAKRPVPPELIKLAK
jgi:hypothetical protein